MKINIYNLWAQKNEEELRPQNLKNPFVSFSAQKILLSEHHGGRQIVAMLKNMNAESKK